MAVHDRTRLIGYLAPEIIDEYRISSYELWQEASVSQLFLCRNSYFVIRNSILQTRNEFRIDVSFRGQVITAETPPTHQRPAGACVGSCGEG